MDTSILNSVKQDIGIMPDYDAFDSQIIRYCNMAFATLHQLGYGPAEGFEITSDKEDWDEYISSKRFNFVKNYVSMKVQYLFDPPTSSIASKALEEELKELEFRIQSEVETYGEEDA